jgi:hypothetical protein
MIDLHWQWLACLLRGAKTHSAHGKRGKVISFCRVTHILSFYHAIKFTATHEWHRPFDAAVSLKWAGCRSRTRQCDIVLKLNFAVVFSGFYI